MIGISRLYLGQAAGSDALRYGRPQDPSFSGRTRKPVVVWNATSRCNLDCRHCYAQTERTGQAAELSTGEARAFIDDLAAFESPVLLFSGGEPLLREDLPELVAHAVSRGLRAAVSSNGTLITPDAAKHLRAAGAAYVGISFDGRRDTHDRFRGRPGAFDAALKGLRTCRAAGLKAGLRFTLTRGTIDDLDDVFGLIRSEDIPRACFYHLVYSGRGAALRDEDLSHDRTRETVDRIMTFAAQERAHGHRREILSVDNHCDGPYLYLRMQRERHPAAGDVLRLLEANGGNASGIAIAGVNWDGTVYPDQFWRRHALGNVRRRAFSAIWSDDTIPLLYGLRHREERLDARCRACRFLAACRGNFRARAEAIGGDPWGLDPACYLTDAEIGPTEARV